MKLFYQFLLLAGVFACSESLFAARLTVYHDTARDNHRITGAQPVRVIVYSTKAKENEGEVIPGFQFERAKVKTEPVTLYSMQDGKPVDNKKATFDSGVHNFVGMVWTVGHNIYSVLIPSSRTMLTGSIMLHADGTYSINFDENGASSTVRTYPGERLK